MAAYRDAVEARRDDDSFAVRYAGERLAILDRDVNAVVRLLGGDLATPCQFTRVAGAMRELGLDYAALAWGRDPASRRQRLAGLPTSCSSGPIGARTAPPHGPSSARELGAFGEHLTHLRARYRRRPTLISILDKASPGWEETGKYAFGSPAVTRS